MEEACLEKRQFLGEFAGYGYEGTIDTIRAEQFSRLGDQIYLDHAGATLYSETQLRDSTNALCQSLFANPHSHSAASRQTNAAIHGIREAILRAFNTNPDEYSVVFTSGATASLKLVGEAFDWSPESEFCYTIDNHTSVLGLRQYVQAAGGRFSVVDQTLSCCCSKSLTESWEKHSTGTPLTTKTRANSLFAFPAESNFSGRLYDLNWIKTVRANGVGHRRNANWKVLVDTTKFCSTHAFDLSEYPADFVTVSFYKLFGYPTGLGCLIVRSEAAAVMNKLYFGGGTVEAAAGNDTFWKPREMLADRFENGSIPFLSIVALAHGFKQLQTLSFARIGSHLSALTSYLVREMSRLRHTPGQPLCEIYGHEAGERYGPIVAFNLLRPSGAYIGYAEVDRLAVVQGIQLRTGCFCNQGACQYYLKMTAEDVKANLEAGHSCGDENDLIDGRPTGAVRVSLGYMSTFEDVYRFLLFLRTFIDEEPAAQFVTTATKRLPTCSLTHILVYPIKSCGFMQVDQWPVVKGVLQYDRQWVLFDPITSVVFNQKMIPQLCLLKPVLDLNTSVLTLTFPNMPSPLVISCGPVGGPKKVLRDCGSLRETTVYGPEVQDWFSAALGRPCQLAQGSGSNANTGQFLLVSHESLARVQELSHEAMPDGGILAFGERFRPNFLIRGSPPFAEDNWAGVRIGEQTFVVKSQCVRCVMVNVDQRSGSNKSSLYSTLGSMRRKDGKNITFGLLLQLEQNSGEVAVIISRDLPVVPQLKTMVDTKSTSTDSRHWHVAGNRVCLVVVALAIMFAKRYKLWSG